MNALARIFHHHVRFLLRKEVLLFFIVSASVMAEGRVFQQEIKIPLGLMWGDAPERLEELARPGGFTITHREDLANKTILTVHGLLGTALQESFFIFQKEALVEIEYRYGNPTWKSLQYQNFFDSFRRMYDAKYGAGTQLIHLDPKKTNEMIISLTGYQWNQSACILELFYYTAEESTEHSYRLVSLHYKAP